MAELGGNVNMVNLGKMFNYGDTYHKRKQIPLLTKCYLS